MELKQYFNIVLRKWWLIASIVIIACLGAGIKSIYFTTPIYQANAKIIVNQPLQVDGTATVNQSAIQTNLLLINSYKEIIRSAAIMNKVAEQYPELDTTPAQLAANISVSSANQSQVMNLTFLDNSYEGAAKAVNAIASVFKEQIPSIMKIDNVTILNEAIVDARANPVNINPAMNIVISFVVSLMLALGLVFLLDYLDNTFRKADDVESELGLPVLAVVLKISKTDRKPGKSSTHSKNKGIGEGKYATLSQ
ncbi:YveK family protein [Paenibacillus tarimensis]